MPSPPDRSTSWPPSSPTPVCVLLNRRTENRDMAGLWEFPGGKRESGETSEQALVRELREELGIEADVGEWLMDVPQRYPDKYLTLEVRHVRSWKGHRVGGGPGHNLGGAGQAGTLFDAAGRPAGGGRTAPTGPLPDHAGAG